MKARQSESAPAASLIEISRVLEETARIVRRHADFQAQPVLPQRADGEPLEITAPLVRAILRIRRIRADFIPEARSDPAWTMILEVFAAGLEGKRINQSRLAYLAEVPHTTGLRIVHTLLEAGILLTDTPDRRQHTLRLSDDAAEKVRTYLSIAIATVPYLA
jgi:predicted transcriptional regulator